MARDSTIRSSLPLQMLLSYHMYWTWIFFILTLAVYIWKATLYPYPESPLGWEISAVVAYLPVNLGRISFMTKGNLTEMAGPLLFGLGGSVLVVIFYSYFIAAQVYVLRIDQILNAIGLCFVIPEIILGVLASVYFVAETRQF